MGSYTLEILSQPIDKQTLQIDTTHPLVTIVVIAVWLFVVAFWSRGFPENPATTGYKHNLMNKTQLFFVKGKTRPKAVLLRKGAVKNLEKDAKDALERRLQC